jgi:hypothetical protein
LTRLTARLEAAPFQNNGKIRIRGIGKEVAEKPMSWLSAIGSG